MYTRSYYPDSEERVNIPDNYDGTAFLERKEPLQQQEAAEVSFIETSESQTKKTQQREDAVMTTGFGSSGILSGLFGALPSLNLKMPQIGTEEILIIAAAAFLFFSKNGDRECALILLLLLLIN